MKVAILDDYQNVALKIADWSVLPKNIQVTVFNDHLADMNAVAKRLADFEIISTVRERTPFRRELLERLPKLQLLLTTGMRNAAIDVDAATELGIVVCGTGTGPLHATAELAWSLILSLLRHVPEENAAIRNGRWQTTVGNALEGKTLGILGLGRLGSVMAVTWKAFSMNVIAWSQNLTAEKATQAGVTLVTKDELFSRSDVLTIHLQLSDRTRGLVQARELKLMKPTAYLVNTSRGPIVDEAALIHTLQTRAIAGAGLDVFEPEPLLPDHPFMKMNNLVMTPHLGYVTEETYRVWFSENVDSIKGFVAGQPARVINTAVLTKAYRGKH
jgi:phosphoglycerate dehydrogenase-like enzyme